MATLAEEQTKKQADRAESIRAGFRGIAELPAATGRFVQRGANQIFDPSTYAPSQIVDRLAGVAAPVVGDAMVAGQAEILPPASAAEAVRTQRLLNPEGKGVVASTIAPQLADAATAIPRNLISAATAPPSQLPTSPMLPMDTHTRTDLPVNVRPKGGGFAAFTAPETTGEQAPQVGFRQALDQTPYETETYDITGGSPEAVLAKAIYASKVEASDANKAANRFKREREFASEQQAEDRLALDAFQAESGRMSARAAMKGAEAAEAKATTGDIGDRLKGLPEIKPLMLKDPMGIEQVAGYNVGGTIVDAPVRPIFEARMAAILKDQRFIDSTAGFTPEEQNRYAADLVVRTMRSENLLGGAATEPEKK